MIKTILFDFNNVLGGIRPDKIPAKTFALFSPFNEAEVGKIVSEIENIPGGLHYGSSFSDFYEIVSKTIKANQNKLSFDRFADAWCNIFFEYQDMEDLLKKLKSQGLQLILVTDTGTLHWETIKALRLVKKFFAKDGQYAASCEFSCRKSDGRLFLFAQKKFNFDFASTLLVDDKPENCAAFARFGGQTILFDHRREKPKKILENLKQKTIR